MEALSYILKILESTIGFFRDKTYSIFYRLGLLLFIVLMPFIIDYYFYVSDSIVYDSQIKTIKEINSLIASKETDSLSKKRLIELRSITLNQTNYKEDASRYFTTFSSSFSRFLKDKETSLTNKKIENPQINNNKKSIFYDELMLNLYKKLPKTLHYITSNWILLIIFLIIPFTLHNDTIYQSKSRGEKLAIISICWLFIIIWGFVFSWITGLIPPHISKSDLLANSLKNIIINIAFILIVSPKTFSSIFRKKSQY